MYNIYVCIIYNCEYINMRGFREMEFLIQDRQCMYKRNIETRSCNHCCSGKAKRMGLSCKFKFVTIQINLLPTSSAYLLLLKKNWKMNSLESTFHIYLCVVPRRDDSILF